MGGILKKYLLVLMISVLIVPVVIQAQDAKYVNIQTAVTELKKQNFVIFALGLLSDGLEESVVQEVTKIQFAPPRQMQIFVTQNDFIQDIYNDFTFLAREKKVNAILVWPSKTWENKDAVSKVCKMSQRLRIPVIGMQEGWIEEGAMLAFVNPENPTLVVNDKIAQIFNFPINDASGFNIVHQ